MIPPVPGDGDGADMAREQIVRTTQRVAALQIALVTLAGIAVVLGIGTAVFVGLGNRDYNQRVEDCTTPGGACYERQQRATTAAIETILTYIKETIEPFRVANAAQNRCQVELFARQPTVLDAGAETALADYAACVAANAAGTEQPEPPPVPLTTTTTRKGGR